MAYVKQTNLHLHFSVLKFEATSPRYFFHEAINWGESKIKGQCGSLFFCLCFLRWSLGGGAGAGGGGAGGGARLNLFLLASMYTGKGRVTTVMIAII